MPPVVDQVTAVLLEPVTVAVNYCVAPVSRAVETGEMDAATTASLNSRVPVPQLVIITRRASRIPRFLLM